MLLGEKLVAFRDTEGQVGVMGRRCPHRCGSLFFGRNEENRIRCVYHGWKFDVDGNCVDMPNVPPHHDFKHKVKARSYKVTERNGLTWVFMGDQSKAPQAPEIEATLLPERDVVLHFVQRECNWLQAISPVMKSRFDQSVSGATMMMITSMAGLPSMFATMAIARAAPN